MKSSLNLSLNLLQFASLLPISACLHENGCYYSDQDGDREDDKQKEEMEEEEEFGSMSTMTQQQAGSAAPRRGNATPRQLWFHDPAFQNVDPSFQIDLRRSFP